MRERTFAEWQLTVSHAAPPLEFGDERFARGRALCEILPLADAGILLPMVVDNLPQCDVGPHDASNEGLVGERRPIAVRRGKVLHQRVVLIGVAI